MKNCTTEPMQSFYVEALNRGRCRVHAFVFFSVQLS